MSLALSSLAVLIASGVLAAVLSRWPRWATGVGAAGAVAGSALGLLPAAAALSGSRSILFSVVIRAGNV